MSSRSFAVVLSARIDQYEAAMRRAQQSTEQFTGQSQSRLEQFGARATAVGGWMRTRVTLPIVAAGAAGIKMAVDFDSSMTRIQSLVGLSASEVDGMRDSVMSLSGSTATAPKELADALFFATSAGLDAADALDAVEWAAKASAVGLGDTSTVVDLTTSAMNAYGSDVLDAAAATDVLTAAVRFGKLEPDQLAGAMGRVLPIASAMGVEFHEVGAAFAAMSRTGTGANEAATQLRGIMTTLLSPSKQSKDALEAVGLTVEGLQAQLANEGLLATLETLVWSLGDNASAAEAVFGNVRALAGVMDMLGGNVESTRQIFGDMTDTAGITSEAFDIASQSVGFRMAQAWTDFKVALMTAGEIILPMVAQFVELVGALASAFGNLPGPAQTAVVVLMGMLAATGPLLMLVGSLIKNLTFLTAAFTALRGAMMAHPILALATVAAAIGTAMYMMGNGVSAAEERVRSLTDAMIAAGDAGEGLTNFLDEVIRSTPELASAMREAGVNLRQVQEAAEAGGEEWQRMGARLLDAAEASGATDDEMVSLIATLRGLDEQSAEAAEALRDYEAAMSESLPSAQSLTQSYIDQALEARQLALATADADAAAEAFADRQEFLANVADATAEAIEREYQSIEDAADALRDRVDSAMQSGAASMRQFSDEGKSSLTDFVGDLMSSLMDLTVWQNNLITIAERGSAEFAMQMAELGPDFAGVVGDIANSTDTDFASAMDAMVGYTDAAQRDMSAEFAKVDPEFKKTLDGLAGMTQLELILLGITASQEGYQVGLSLASGMSAGITANSSLISSAASTAVSNAVNAARREAGISSPSRVFAEQVGKPSAEGITVGFEDEMRRSFGPAVGKALLSPIGNYVTHHNSSPTSMTNNSTGVVIEHAVFNDAADVDAVYRAANLSMAVA